MKSSRENWRRSWQAVTRGTMFEMSVLLIAIVGVGWAIVATISLGMRTGSDLQYGGAREEIAAIIEHRGPEGVAVHRRMLDSAGASVVGVDVLEVSGDSVDLPSLATGGFLRDQIEQFNEHAMLQAWMPRLLGTDDDAAASPSPSLFRLARTDDRRYVLSSRLNAYALRVTSPGSASAGTSVRSADWHSGPTVVGLLDELAIGGPNNSISSSRQLSHSECAAKTIVPTKHLLYCGSLAGSDVDRAYNVSIETKGGASFDQGARLMQDRRESLWLNGVRGRTPASASRGDLLFTPRAGPIALADVETGQLAGPQWVNGGAQFRVNRAGSLRYFGRAGLSVSPPRGEASLILSIDAQLTSDLDTRIARFMKRNRGYLESISVSVVDLASGEIKTVAESDPGDEKPLLAFEPVLLGSMSKPIIASAILARQPELASLTVTRSPGEVTSAGGITLAAPMNNPSNGCPDVITFELFLQCSSNQYAAELLITSLQRSAGRKDIAKGGRVANPILEASALADGILTLFDDADVVSGRTAGHSPRLWQRDSASNAATDAVPRDPSLLPWMSRPWFVYPDSSGVPVDWLARFAIGGWENRWTPIGALEAYARIATDRRVHLSLRRQPAGALGGGAMPGDATRAFAVVRRGLRAVAQKGTAAGLDRGMASIATNPASVVVLAKTGTLNEVSARTDEEGVFIKALAVVVGAPRSTDDGAALRCGLGSIIYLQFRQDWRQLMRLPEGSRLPDLHREFAEAELAASLRALWKRSDPCPGKVK